MIPALHMPHPHVVNGVCPLEADANHVAVLE